MRIAPSLLNYQATNKRIPKRPREPVDHSQEAKPIKHTIHFGRKNDIIHIEEPKQNETKLWTIRVRVNQNMRRGRSELQRRPA